jgi:queuine tRNA-ribosyltransferase
MSLRFDIAARSRQTQARLGRVTTPNGSFDTPAFMPVGTRGTVKGLLPGMVEATGAQIILGNTYHLMLRPGDELVRRVGGLHVFANWRRPMLTDSGGYQAYSMADLNKVSDDGVTFKSIVDGSLIHLTPERSIQIQNNLGADIIMAFDDCPPSEAAGSAGAATQAAAGSDPRLQRALRRDTGKKREYDHGARLREANERTVRWLERCKAAHQRPGDQALFGIVQGGTDFDQRTWSAQHICGVDLPGYAIGGVAVGERSEQIAQVVRHTAPLLPQAKPRYLMGVGYERDLLAAVLAGVDMFDCVLPTRNGRNAEAFTRDGHLKLRNAKFAEDTAPLEPGCDCPACAPTLHMWAGAFGPADTERKQIMAADKRRPVPSLNDSPFSRAYIRHLFMANEMLGPILVSLHNLRYFQRFMADLRRCIATDDWQGLVARWPMSAPALDGLTLGVPER